MAEPLNEEQSVFDKPEGWEAPPPETSSDMGLYVLLSIALIWLGWTLYKRYEVELRSLVKSDRRHVTRVPQLEAPATLIASGPTRDEYVQNLRRRLQQQNAEKEAAAAAKLREADQQWRAERTNAEERLQSYANANAAADALQKGTASVSSVAPSAASSTSRAPNHRSAPVVVATEGTTPRSAEIKSDISPVSAVSARSDTPADIISPVELARLRRDLAASRLPSLPAEDLPAEEVILINIRCPDLAGEARLERRFLTTDPLQAVMDFVQTSLALGMAGKHIVTLIPRKIVCSWEDYDIRNVHSRADADVLRSVPYPSGTVPSRQLKDLFTEERVTLIVRSANITQDLQR